MEDGPIFMYLIDQFSILKWTTCNPCMLDIHINESQGNLVRII